MEGTFWRSLPFDGTVSMYCLSQSFFSSLCRLPTCSCSNYEGDAKTTCLRRILSYKGRSMGRRAQRLELSPPPTSAGTDVAAAEAPPSSPPPMEIRHGRGGFLLTAAFSSADAEAPTPSTLAVEPRWHKTPHHEAREHDHSAQKKKKQ